MARAQALFLLARRQRYRMLYNAYDTISITHTPGDIWRGLLVVLDDEERECKKQRNASMEKISRRVIFKATISVISVISVVCTSIG